MAMATTMTKTHKRKRKHDGYKQSLLFVTATSWDKINFTENSCQRHQAFGNITKHRKPEDKINYWNLGQHQTEFGNK